MPTILYTAASGARSQIARTEGEIAALFSAADRATLNAGGALTCDCGPPLGTVTIARADRITRAPSVAPSKMSGATA